MPALYVFLRHLISLVYPARCPVCNEIISATDTFCDKCMNELVAYRQKLRIPTVNKFVALFEYNDKIYPAVYNLKNNICGNASYAFGVSLAQLINSEGLTADFIVPVPMYRTDIEQRRYNQAELIAKYTGKFLDMKVYSDIVIKIRKTYEQKNLKFAERRKNLKNAFYVTDSSKVKGRRIIIIDDICTTGSTLSEVASTLKKSGASEIYCACACKTVLKKPMNEHI